MSDDVKAAAHTPGPWRLGQEFNNRVYGPDEMGEHSGLLAVVYKGRPNARLIAAAPDMLKALRIIAAIIHCGDDPDGSGFFDITSSEIDQVFSAIAKAEAKP